MSPTAEQAVEQKSTELVVASTWVLAGGSLKTLARECALKAMGVLDCMGFEGHAVCGQYFYRSLALQHPEMCSGGLEAKSESTLYRFGGGTSTADKTGTIKPVWLGKQQTLRVDVVSGTLPLLLGREFGAEYALVADIRRGDVYTRRRGESTLVATNPPGGLLKLSLRGVVDQNLQRDFVEYVVCGASANTYELLGDIPCTVHLSNH